MAGGLLEAFEEIPISASISAVLHGLAWSTSIIMARWKVRHGAVERPLSPGGRDRLDAVEELKTAPIKRDQIRRQLEPMGDLERLAGKVTLGRANARDLVALRQSRPNTMASSAS